MEYGIGKCPSAVVRLLDMESLLTFSKHCQSDLEFDHEFISELRTYLMHCVRRLNGGKGATVREMHEKMVQAKVSRVPLSLDELRELLQTLVFDYLVEEIDPEPGTEEPLFIAARRVSAPCDFKWWSGILEPDFHFRAIKFEDGVTLAPHEPHYHTA